MFNETMSLVQERHRDPELVTWFRFVRVMRKLIAQMDQLMLDLDLSRSQFSLLTQVAFEEGINQQTCAGRLNVTKGNVTQHIDKLEKQGLIERRKDGRTNFLYLTDSGKERVAAIMPVHDQRVKEILAALSHPDLMQFQSILRKLDRNLD